MKRFANRRHFVVFSLVFSLTMLVTGSASASNNDPRTYRVTVFNLTGGQPFTPPIIATHSRHFHIFERREEASIGVQEIAENGNLDPMIGILEDSSKVTDFAVAVAGDPPPLMPGSSVSVEVTAYPNDVVSMISMLICTNDGFAGLDSKRLPNRVGAFKTFGMRGYDAGTEINTEAFEDIVPPCGPLTGVDSGGAGTGMSNPDLAEGGVIRRDRRAGGNIEGIADLVPSIHDWSGAVGILYIQRID